VEPQDEGFVFVCQDRAVGAPDERQHFDEMVVVVIDRQIRPFHRSALRAFLNRERRHDRPRLHGCRRARIVLFLFLDAHCQVHIGTVANRQSAMDVERQRKIIHVDMDAF
jgi:hypothetical protein